MHLLYSLSKDLRINSRMPNHIERVNFTDRINAVVSRIVGVQPSDNRANAVDQEEVRFLVTGVAFKALQERGAHPSLRRFRSRLSCEQVIGEDRWGWFFRHSDYQ